MGLVTKILILIAMVASFTSVADAIAGQATFYTPPYTPSSCYGYKNTHGVMILAANGGMFAHKGICGKRFRVRCTSGTNAGVPHPCRGNSIVVTAVDLCPGCAGNQIDLSAEAFAMIADPNEGKINIEYHE
ncbi:EG45-like domain containing protein [Rutidosis leptorrhynchoides]|uniref:EG45-like domain containing protein n=1 Tax=Rutidosis leptorrhynchoides TaxID=125765 RepID=UPI003A9A04C0